MWHAWRRKEMHMEFQLGNMEGRHHVADLGVDEGTILK
jgi:hypothetical protein